VKVEDLFGLSKPDVWEPPVVLTIAGSDSGGGAGVQADLKTFAATKSFGTSVITLLTAQNTIGVTDIFMVPEQSVRKQFAAVMSDLKPKAAKTGALGNDVMLRVIGNLLIEQPIEKLVVDPVMVSKHGDLLMSDTAMKAFRDTVLPHALVVTPNRFEAEHLSGRSVEGPTSMKDASKAIYDIAGTAVVIKGSHLDGIVRDYLYDGTGFIEFGADRVDSKRVHGSGCVFSAAITSRLGHGDDLPTAVQFAREFITRAIELAPALGEGISPVNPMHKVWNER
jgi:hydroxymethylpyrimidine/phosphomethylpyrimidine kinase